jgi:metacaspase-1
MHRHQRLPGHGQRPSRVRQRRQRLGRGALGPGYDASFDGRPNGAFTYFALATLKELPAGATYRDWVREIRGHLPSQSYPQTPGLQGSRRMRGWGVLEEASLAGRPAPA